MWSWWARTVDQQRVRETQAVSVNCWTSYGWCLLMLKLFKSLWKGYGAEKKQQKTKHRLELCLYFPDNWHVIWSKSNFKIHNLGILGKFHSHQAAVMAFSWENVKCMRYVSLEVKKKPFLLLEGRDCNKHYCRRCLMTVKRTRIKVHTVEEPQS